MKIKRIGHVALRVNDEQRSRHFYKNILGFDVSEEDPEHGGVFMTLGDNFHTIDVFGHPLDRASHVADQGSALGLDTGFGEALDEAAKYSFLKAPRWKGNAVEVGPLARYIIGYAQGKPEFKEPTEKLLKALNVPVTALFSTLGRTAARGLECQWAVNKLRAQQDKLLATIKAGDLSTANTDKWQPSSWPSTSGRMPRGSRAPISFLFDSATNA